MVPHPDARISDLGPDDRLHLQCVCQRVVIIPPRVLLHDMRLPLDNSYML